MDDNQDHYGVLGLSVVHRHTVTGLALIRVKYNKAVRGIRLTQVAVILLMIVLLLTHAISIGVAAGVSVLIAMLAFLLIRRGQNVATERVSQALRNSIDNEAAAELSINPEDMDTALDILTAGMTPVGETSVINVEDDELVLCEALPVNTDDNEK